MKNKIRLYRSQTISRGQAVGTRTARLNELGVVAGIGSLLDLAGTGFSFTPTKRIPGFESDVQNLRSDFDAAVERASQTHPQMRIKG